jgi:aryl-alcohol dehydrogenase-like predicted oxidoreductase
MSNNFSHTNFGNSGPNVCRLGLSATYRPGKETIYAAVDHGLNFFFCYGFDTHMTKTLRDVFGANREKYLVTTGFYNLIWGHTNIRRTLEKRLRQMKTDYIDVFLFLGVTKEKQFSSKVKDEMLQLRAEGKVKAIGVSTHDRKFAGRLMAEGDLNAIMMRYNAAHRGAEIDIFPHLEKHNPGVISYTATRWGYLLRPPKGWPKEGQLPTPGMCYRFVLSNNNVDVCLTAPRNKKQLEENIAALVSGPLSGDEMAFMRKFGDAVHDSKNWFM